MKRVFVFIFMVILSFGIRSLTIHSQLDDGFILQEGESQHCFFMGFDAMVFGHLHPSDGSNGISFPFF